MSNIPPHPAARQNPSRNGTSLSTALQAGVDNGETSCQAGRTSVVAALFFEGRHKKGTPIAANDRGFPLSAFLYLTRASAAASAMTAVYKTKSSNPVGACSKIRGIRRARTLGTGIVSFLMNHSGESARTRPYIGIDTTGFAAIEPEIVRTFATF